MSSTPIAYQPEYEHAEDDEAQTAQELTDTLLEIGRKVQQDEGHAYRPVHAKSHGLLRAQLAIAPDLPAPYAQGLAATGPQLPVVMRFSTTPGDLLADSVSTPRGVAIKISTPQGEQDFVMINGPAFNAGSAKQFLRSLKLLAATTDKAPALKSALSAALRGIEAVIEKAGGESATIKSLGGQPATQLLGDTFFTQVPLLWGPYMAKVSLEPISPSLVALRDVKVESIRDRPDALREETRAFFLEHGGAWALRVQLCTDLEKMPIEDPTVAWPEDVSPWVTIGHVVADPQDAWTEANSRSVDDCMSFSPWNALPEHRPLGSIMRVRKLAYASAAAFRMQGNGCPMHRD